MAGKDECSDALYKEDVLVLCEISRKLRIMKMSQ